MTRTHEQPWERVGQIVARLNEVNGTGEHERAMRLLKILEEAGEAAQAYAGTTGQNPRKGVSHSRSDVADELCDVIVAAMVALHDHTDDPAATFGRVLAHRAARILGEASR